MSDFLLHALGVSIIVLISIYYAVLIKLLLSL